MLIASLLVSLATWAAIFTRIAHDPVNHVGPEPLLAAIPLVLPLVVSLIPAYRPRRALRAAIAAYALGSLAALVAMDRANVLVQYDRWARRGMPERPCGDLVWSFWACCSEDRERVSCSQPGARLR